MKIQDIYEDYGQLHEKGCELLNGGGSFDGCTCAMKSMVGELVAVIMHTEGNVIIGNLKKELADNERWLREVLTDFQIPFDDHKIGRRLALTQWMIEHRSFMFPNDAIISKRE